MGRRMKKVDKAKFIQAINTVEADGGLSNFNELHVKVAEVYNQNSPPEEITFSVVGLRIKEFGLEDKLKTKKGKRGRAKGTNFSGGTRQARGDKFREDKSLQDAFSLLKRNTPERFHSTVDKLVEGSMAAAVKLKCIDCSGGDACLSDDTRSITKEIRECPIKDCSLYAFRPYQ